VDRVEYAQLLHDASEVQIKGLEDWQVKRANQPTKPELPLLLPQVKPNITIPVIELFLK
jgi:alpha-L-fucosidase